jgi:hypothetical protein
VAPPGVTVASYDSGFGTVTDAFKPGQEPGASGPIGSGGQAAAQAATADNGDGTSAPGTAAGPAPTAGVDTSMPGLY